jgi:hypothetical protein
MAITLDPAIEQRIQTELSRGAFAEPAELLAHALDLVQAEEDWLLRNKVSIVAHLEESFAQSERGETYSVEEGRAMLAERRAARVSQ